MIILLCILGIIVIAVACYAISRQPDTIEIEMYDDFDDDDDIFFID